MITTGATWAADISAPARKIKAKVLHYKSYTLKNTFWPNTELVSVKIEKIPTNGSFFGYSICQKATIELIDLNKFNIAKNDKLEIYLGTENELIKQPTFYVDEVVRDEVKKRTTITAYDLLHKASQYLQKDLTIEFPITLTAYADVVATQLGTTIEWIYTGSDFTNIEYTQGTPPNFGGTETLRSVLNAIAEATGSICFMNNENKICMKRLYNDPVYTISKDDYFELTLGKAFTLTQITHATELGDNYIAGVAGGHNQVLRNNSFLENREDITTILDTLLGCVKGTILYHYSIKWRANPAIEIGDCVNIDGKNIYYLGETIKYTGGMSATSEWEDAEQENPDGTPTTIGQTLIQTFAKVDKVNNRIELVAGTVSDHETAISNLQIDANGIMGSVSSVQSNLDKAVEGLNEDIEKVNKRVDLAITDEQVQIKIDKAMEKGAESITTSTGYTFNQDGLTVSKSGSEMTTTISEDGMTVYRDNVEVLVADNTGVIARNLHAETYLIIGNNSRFEDYVNTSGEARTGCFWIGG